MQDRTEYRAIMPMGETPDDCPQCGAMMAVFTFQERFIDMTGKELSYPYQECWCCEFSTKASKFGKFLDDQFNNLP